ncbi:MAG: hypothetical protein ABT940_14195, partial [Alphaproteobacteria bacterium]
TRNAPANSDYAPYLDTYADRDRFLGKGWLDLPALARSGFPIAEILGKRPLLPTPSAITVNNHFGNDPPAMAARQLMEILFGPMAGARAIPGGWTDDVARKGRQILMNCSRPPLDDNAFAVAAVGVNVLPYLSPTEGRMMFERMGGLACLESLRGARAQWRTLIGHVADRNVEGHGVVAENLLRAGEGVTSARGKYLLGLSVLGHLGAGDRHRARTVWETLAADVVKDQPLGLELEMIRAHALER